MQKICQQEHYRAAVEDVVQECKPGRNVCAGVFRLEEEHFANQAQNVASAFPRRQIEFHLIAEEEEADFVAASGSRDSQSSSNFCRNSRLVRRKEPKAEDAETSTARRSASS